MTIQLKYKDQLTPCQIFKSTTVKHILDIVKQNMDLVPNTVRLKYKDSYLNNNSKNLIEDLQIKESDIIEIEGTYFPISLFGKGFTFAQNLGLYSSTKCIICMETVKDIHIFDCGHANVCRKCYKEYGKDKCPTCNQ